MKTSFKIGEISGIPVRIHITLLIIVGFLAWSIGSNLFQLAELLGIDHTGISPGFQSYLIGIIMAVGLFVSVFLHEVAHSLVARGMGVRVEEISLWIFGGVSNMEEIPREPDSEIKVSVVGPLTSFGIGIICYSIGVFSSGIASLSFIFVYLGVINVILGGFNLIPAFPMDGGRILRASLAKRESYVTATNRAASVGKMIAIMIGIFGIFYNFFLILIAFFIYIGASQESQTIMVREVLQKVKVRDVMSEKVKTVSPDMNLRDFLDYVIRVQHTGFPVVEDEEIIGIITMEDAKKVAKERTSQVDVRDVMEEEVECISPDDDMSEVWQKMSEREVGRFPVLTPEGELVGIVTRSDVMHSFNVLKEIEEYRGGEI
ncbi:hypothetical protein AKJ36_00325 [candidate division MSBL1 archaeon SCGC-AAA259I07]|uniref:Zinc metalloprotease n=2 Tax=candidate division MSBL1 TaxID=215777 RepID=A0A133U904_9EURY|nr:hypothetical protein AKJ61_00110 [candidate division MSBL1 archaeon SCGC-AAA259B11]KXA95525.1 hypothetical protein AKJ36_00325 [candidate division MSBL1 archaeon SCGC-AAA259I07]